MTLADKKDQFFMGLAKLRILTGEKLGKKTFPGARYAFSVEESALSRLKANLRRKDPR